MIPGICRFCLREAELRNSHIIPKSVINPLKIGTGKVVQIQGKGRYGIQPLQDGLKQFLFCGDCEQFFSAKYEVPFLADWKRVALGGPWDLRRLVATKVTYDKFKLFHLLNLFRSSASSHPELRGVSLGAEEELIRKMLLDGDPGPHSRYAVGGCVLYDESNGVPIEMVGYPDLVLDACGATYKMIYANTEWTVFLSGDRPELLRHWALQEDGSLRLLGKPWSTHPESVRVARQLAGKDIWEG